MTIIQSIETKMNILKNKAVIVGNYRKHLVK